MQTTIRGTPIDELLMQHLHNFRSQHEVTTRVKYLLNGATWQVVDYPKGLAFYKDDSWAGGEITNVLQGAPADHPVVHELITQANNTLSDVTQMSKDNPLLHYNQEHNNNRISNSIMAAVASRDDALFETYLKVGFHLIQNPVLTRTKPPEEEYIMFELAGLENFYEKHARELRKFLEKIDELNLGSYLPMNILCGLGDLAALDRFVDLYKEFGDPEFSRFVYRGWKKGLCWHAFASHLKHHLKERSTYSKEAIDNHILSLISEVKDDKREGLTNILMGAWYE